MLGGSANNQCSENKVTRMLTKRLIKLKITYTDNILAKEIHWRTMLAWQKYRPLQNFHFIQENIDQHIKSKTLYEVIRK